MHSWDRVIIIIFMNHGMFIRLGPQDGPRPRRGLSLLLGHDGEEQPGLHHHLHIQHKCHHNHHHHQLHPHHQHHLHPIGIINDMILIFFSCLDMMKRNNHVSPHQENNNHQHNPPWYDGDPNGLKILTLMIILTLMALSALLIGRAKEGAGKAVDGRGQVFLIVNMITATSFKWSYWLHINGYWLWR